jgi:hypothetical protein
VSSGEAAHRLEQELAPELPDAASKQAAMIARLVELPCWRLQYGGRPQEVAQKIAERFESGQLTDASRLGHELGPEVGVASDTQDGMEGPSGCVPRNGARTEKSSDPIHRFTPTPYSTLLSVMGRTLRLETNDSRILERATQVFTRYPGNRNSNPQFVWKILCHSRPNMEPPWPQRFVFSDRGLRFAEYGQNNFLAVDLEAREGIGAFCEHLMNDDLGFVSLFLANLFCLTAGSLGLVPLWGNCVAFRQQGVLLFGPENSGKTSVTHVATKLGLDFQADDGVFVEHEGGELRCWGGFWPVSFRPEALQFFPELRTSTEPFRYRHFTFRHQVKRQSFVTPAYPVKPIACVFLERCAAESPQLIRFRQEGAQPPFQSLPFVEDSSFEGTRNEVMRHLGELPTYRLAYSDDPATAAELLPDLLKGIL